jgi:Protein of unknown function (DUF3034)
MIPLLAACAAALLVSGTAPAHAGKLRLTGGVSSLDGAAGGGLTPWAVTGSLASEGEWGGTAHTTAMRTHDYSLASAGALLSWNDRVEVSIARQRLDTRSSLAAIGLTGLVLQQDIVGLKLRAAGDAVLDSDRWMPQIAVGLLHKRADAGALAPTLFGPLGARRSGSEIYLSATKLWLASGLLGNLTLRASSANQNGLLGFGGAQGKGVQLRPEISLVWLLGPGLALGAEWRAKPDNLRRSALGDGTLAEQRWADVFFAWAPNKQLSLTLAWVDLGRIVPGVQPRRQTGAYASMQLAF